VGLLFIVPEQARKKRYSIRLKGKICCTLQPTKERKKGSPSSLSHLLSQGGKGENSLIGLSLEEKREGGGIGVGLVPGLLTRARLARRKKKRKGYSRKLYEFIITATGGPANPPGWGEGDCAKFSRMRISGHAQQKKNLDLMTCSQGKKKKKKKKDRFCRSSKKEKKTKIHA